MQPDGWVFSENQLLNIVMKVIKHPNGADFFVVSRFAFPVSGICARRGMPFNWRVEPRVLQKLANVVYFYTPFA
jgi:hypothetical protein